MRKLLLRIFVKDYQNYSNPKVRAAYGSLSAIVGIISNFLLSAIKMITGFLIGSISITADGINNLSDAASSILTLIGLKISNKPADKNHPYGHQRFEYVTALVVAFFILVVGGIMLKSSIEKIINPKSIEVSFPIIIILVVSILVKFWQSSFYRVNGKLINSQALINTSVDSMNDTLSTAAVLISCLVLYFLKVNIDGYIGVLISLFIIINGLKLVKDTMSFLIGKAPSKGFIDKVTSEILSYEGVLGIHDLDIHSYGPSKTFITVHVEVDYRVNIVESHDIIDNIEYDFMEKYNINLVIHMDPIDMVNEDTLQLRDLVRRILEDIDPKLDFHDFRVVKGTTHTKIVFDVVVPIKHTLGVEEIKSEIVKRIKEYDQTIYPVINFDFSYLEE